jgi:hypothetical protein
MTDITKVSPLEQELPHQAVGVFVRAALPGTVPSREVNQHARGRGQLLMFGEFLAVVKRQRAAAGPAAAR